MQKTLIAPEHVLFDESKTKVCLITDINKANLLLLNRSINTQEFDLLYDSEIHEIEQILRQVTETIRFRMTLQQIAEELFEMRKRQARRFDEEGD